MTGILGCCAILSSSGSCFVRTLCYELSFLGGPAWQLIASLSYISPFATTRQWYLKGDDKSRQCVEKQRHFSANKSPYGQGCGLPSGHVWLWILDHEEGRTAKNWCLWTVVLEKTPESPFDSKEIKPVKLKGDQSWIFTGRTDAEAETPVFGSSDVNRQVFGKVPDAGKDWGQKKKRASEDEMAGQHHWYNEHKPGQTLGDGEGQGGLVCYSPWGHKQSDMTGWLKNNNSIFLGT